MCPGTNCCWESASPTHVMLTAWLSPANGGIVRRCLCSCVVKTVLCMNRIWHADIVRAFGVAHGHTFHGMGLPGGWGQASRPWCVFGTIVPLHFCRCVRFCTTILHDRLVVLSVVCRRVCVALKIGVSKSCAWLGWQFIIMRCAQRRCSCTQWLFVWDDVGCTPCSLCHWQGSRACTI